MKQTLKKRNPSLGIMLMLFLLFSGFTTFNLNAQEKVTGTVLDNTGNPVPGASVIQKGTKNGASTDFDGNFAITLRSGSKSLVISSIGLKTQEVSVVGKTSINVVLQEDTQTLDEIVVIGFREVEREKLLGAVTTVKAQSIEQATPTQAFDAVQGKLAGVNILSNNGPGQGFDVSIRGLNSFAAGSPLFVVDGQQVRNIDNIDPSDIASFEVVKDAASAAIYGVEGAAGVVLITTKSGKSGKLNVQVTQITGINSLVGDLSVANTAERFLLEKKRSGNLDNLPRFERDSLSLLRRNDYDLQDLLTRPALRTQTNVALSGGTDKMKYYWNTGYIRDEGVVINSAYKRINSLFKLDINVSDKFKLGTRNSISGEDKEGLTEGGVFTHLVERLAYLPLYNPDGTFTPTIGGRKNPLAFANLQVRDDRNFRMQTFNYGELEILPKLKIRSTLGINWRYRKRDDFDTKLIANRPQTGTDQARVRQDLTYRIQQDNILTYKNNWDKHNLSVIAGTQLLKNVAENTDFRSRILNNGYIETLINASPGTITADGGRERYSTFGLFTGFDYDYDNKYLVGATIRRDGSSRFGDENKYGYFPSVNAGWRISRENFLKESELIDNLLLRASWGTVGNQSNIPNYDYLSAYDPGFAYDGVSGIAATRLGNSQLGWEETESINLGLDLDMFKRRLSLNVDFWEKKTRDVLATTPLPEESGFTGILRNVGAIENRGVDVNISGTIIKSEDFTWDANFNIGYLENNVTKLSGGTEFYPGGRYLVREGEAIGNIFGYNNLGVFQYNESNAYADDGTRLTANFDDSGTFVNYTLGGSEYTGTINRLKVNGRTLQGGDIMWEDLDGNFNITATDRKKLGNGLATTSGGFSNDIRYKNFSVSFLFNFVLNHDIYNRWDEDRNDLAAGAESPGPERIYGAWFEPGDQTIYPRLDRVPQNRLKPNSFFVTDGSFIKWRYLRFNYDFPTEMLNNIGFLEKVSLNLAVNNVLTWTNYNGYNPELGNRGSALTPNQDQLRYPNDREIILGLKVNF